MWYRMSVRGPDPTVSDAELIAAVKTTEYPFATIKDVSDAVGLSRERVRQRLNKLSGTGSINRTKTSGVIIYWLPSE